MKSEKEIREQKSKVRSFLPPQGYEDPIEKAEDDGYEKALNWVLGGEEREELEKRVSSVFKNLLNDYEEGLAKLGNSELSRLYKMIYEIQCWIDNPKREVGRI